MPTMQALETSAINAAKKSDWSGAININLEILNNNTHNIPALNRLGFAYLQLGKLRKASQTFNEVLELDKSNLIAKKQLENIKNKVITAPQFQAQNFVEEPSKSKIISLNRLASKQILTSLHVGQELVLKPKSRFISVETADKQYLGSMPEDISLRLSQLITTGNRYLCQLHSSSANSCTVFVRETYQAPANRHRLSFVSVYQANEDENIGSDLLLLTDDVPIDIIQDGSEENEESKNQADDDN